MLFLNCLNRSSLRLLDCTILFSPAKFHFQSLQMKERTDFLSNLIQGVQKQAKFSSQTPQLFVRSQLNLLFLACYTRGVTFAERETLQFISMKPGCERGSAGGSRCSNVFPLWLYFQDFDSQITPKNHSIKWLSLCSHRLKVTLTV